MTGRLIESHGPRVPLCCDCKYAGEEGFCEKTGVSQSFSRKPLKEVIANAVEAVARQPASMSRFAGKFRYEHEGLKCR